MQPFDFFDTLSSPRGGDKGGWNSGKSRNKNVNLSNLEVKTMNCWSLNPENNIFVAAHRGWSDKYPENTMESFRGAVEIGVDQLEIDVRVTKDNELVVIHDPTVDRTTNGTGKVIDLTLAQLKALDAGSHKGPEFAGCRIPTFLEFMEYVKDLPTMTVDVELKEYPDVVGPNLSYDVCDRILKIIDDYGYTDRVVLNTWSGTLHDYIHHKYGDKYRLHLYWPVDCLRENEKMDPKPYSYGYCCCMFPSQEQKQQGFVVASREECDAMIAMGIQPWAGAGVKTEQGVLEAIEKGCYLITCNNPDEILAWLRKHGKHK